MSQCCDTQQIDFLLLPREIQIQICKYVGSSELETLRSFLLCAKLFSYPREERIYQERSEYYFPKYLPFRDNLRWREFHDRIVTLQKNEPIEYAKKCSCESKLLELQILHLDNPMFINWVLPLDLVCAAGDLKLLSWFMSIGRTPNMFGVNLIADEGHIECLEFLYEKTGLLPDTDGANWVAETGYLYILEWLANHNIFPNNIGANFAARNNHLHILNWLEQHDIFPQGYLHISNPQIIRWLKDRNLYIASDPESDIEEDYD